jgi:hypothetical protein
MIVIASTAVRINVGSPLSSMAIAGADIMGGAAARRANPSMRPGSRLARPSTAVAALTRAGGVRTKQRQVRTSVPGLVSSWIKAPGSTRMKVVVTKKKIATPSMGRATAASCGRARPTNRLMMKPCVP